MHCRHPRLNLSYHVTIKTEKFDALNLKTRHAWRLRRCQSTFPFCHSRLRRSPFAWKDTRVLVQIFSIHTYVLCTQTNTREHLRGVQDFLVTKVICTRESRRERREKETGQRSHFITEWQLRLTRISFVFCTVIIFFPSSYPLLIFVALYLIEG